MRTLESRLDAIHWTAGNAVADRVDPIVRVVFMNMRMSEINDSNGDFESLERLNLAENILAMGRSENPRFLRFHWEDKSVGWAFAHSLTHEVAQAALNPEIKGEAMLGLAVVKMEIAQAANSLELAKEAKDLLDQAAGSSDRLSRRINWMDWSLGGDYMGYIGDHATLLVDRLAFEKETEEGLWHLDEEMVRRLTPTEKAMNLKSQMQDWLASY